MDTFFDEHEEHQCVLPDEQANHITFLFQGCILPILVIAGIVNNILTIRILCKMKNVCATVFILKALGVVDTLYLFSLIGTWILYSWYEVLGQLCEYIEQFTLAIPFLMGFYEISCDIAVWVFLMLVIERYVSMAHFVLQIRSCDPHSVTAGIVVVTLSFLFATCFNIPALAQYRIISATVSENGSSEVVMPVGLATMDNAKYSYYVLDCILNLYIPTILVIFMTLHGCIILCRQNASQTTLASRIKLDDATPKIDKGEFATMACLICGFLFIICETPRVIESSVVISEVDLEDDLFMIIVHACSVSFKTLQAINSFIKLYIYCSFSKEFKMTVSTVYSRRNYGRVGRTFTISNNNQHGRSEERQGMVELGSDDLLSDYETRV